MNSLGYNEESIAMMELSLCDGIGPVLGKHLLQHFGSATSIFSANRSDWNDVVGLSEKQKFQLHLGKENELKAANELAKNHIALGIKAFTLNNPEYPYRLKELGNAPLVLFSLGDIHWNAPRVVGVVGTRKPSPQGIGITKKIIEELRHYNIQIVSGLAFGIDIVAHQTATEIGIPNWAVLAHGLDQVYPKPHESQARKMCKNMGGLISDFPAYTKMHPDYFPKRNRIVAGLCDALLVIESGVKGGSMITASIAHGYNRDVFAVPGRPSDNPSEGCNFLIKKNMAQLTTCAQDIAEAMSWNKNPIPSHPNNPIGNSCNQLFGNQPNSLDSYPGTNPLNQLNPVETQVMKWLIDGIKKPDDMFQQNQWSAGHISMALLDLEMKGMITTLPGNQYMSMM